MARPSPLLILVALLAGLGGLAACGGRDGGGGAAAGAPQRATELTVFAAASLTDAYREIGRGFEQANPGVKVVFNFAGSQQLAAQLGQGAPADVFASANAAQMQAAVDAGRVAKDASKTFALNRLVVVAAPSSRAAITSLPDLAKPGVKLLFAAEQVPVGRYTLEFLDKAAGDPALGQGYKDAVLRNVVSYEDNVRALLTKVSLGEGDAGVAYVSDVVGSPRTPVQQIEIPAALNVLASYPIAAVSDSRHAALAQQFVDYMFADDARAVLARYGFTLP
jgi:molybdate transport system substrate-binding protein